MNMKDKEYGEKSKWYDLSVLDKVYFIMIGHEGSWLWDATHPLNQDEDWCINFIEHFVSVYGEPRDTYDPKTWDTIHLSMEDHKSFGFDE